MPGPFSRTLASEEPWWRGPLFLLWLFATVVVTTKPDDWSGQPVASAVLMAATPLCFALMGWLQRLAPPTALSLNLHRWLLLIGYEAVHLNLLLQANYLRWLIGSTIVVAGGQYLLAKRYDRQQAEPQFRR